MRFFGSVIGLPLRLEYKQTYEKRTDSLFNVYIYAFECHNDNI